jgi:hypothetical protein
MAPETKGLNGTSMTEFPTRRLSHIAEMPRYRAVFRVLRMCTGRDWTGWLG